MFFLKFRLGELVGCGIKFCIQWVPTQHTFDGPHYPKNKKYLKRRDDDMHPTSSLNRNLSKNTGRYVENTNKKVVFFFSSPKINKYYFIILTIILLIFLGGPFWVEISSNGVEIIPSWLRGSVDVFVNLECIHLYILCIIPWCFYWEVSVM